MRQILTALLLSLTFSSFAQDTSHRVQGQGNLTIQEYVAELIKQLGSPKFGTRENASRKLVEIGEPALEPLHQALKNSDAEIRFRSRRAIGAIETLIARRDLAAVLQRAATMEIRSKREDGTEQSLSFRAVPVDVLPPMYHWYMPDVPKAQLDQMKISLYRLFPAYEGDGGAALPGSEGSLQYLYTMEEKNIQEKDGLARLHYVADSPTGLRANGMIVRGSVKGGLSLGGDFERQELSQLILLKRPHNAFTYRFLEPDFVENAQKLFNKKK